MTSTPAASSEAIKLSDPDICWPCENRLAAGVVASGCSAPGSAGVVPRLGMSVTDMEFPFPRCGSV
jgi:hypothetical protein